MKKIFYILGLFLLMIPFKANALGNSYSVLVNELPFSMSNSFQAWDYNTRGGVGVYTTPSSVKVGSFSYNTIASKDYVLSFSTSENFVPGYVYSISVLFSNSGLYTTTNPEPTKKYNITNPCDFLSVGYSYNFFSNYDGAKILACSQADFERIMLTTQYEISSAPDGMHDWLVDNQIFTFTFVANELPVNESQYNTISIRFKGNAEFIGYYISSLGYYSTITDTTLSQQITDVETSINNNIDSMKEKQDETNKQLGDLNDNITSSEVDSSGATGFFDDFEDNDYGLYDIITAPLEFIKTLTNQTCNTMTLDLPFVEGTITLPCMSEIYSKWFGKLFILYQTITTGFIAYWVGVRILFLVKGFKDPENDRIEVMDL